MHFRLNALRCSASAAFLATKSVSAPSCATILCTSLLQSFKYIQRLFLNELEDSGRCGANVPVPDLDLLS